MIGIIISDYNTYEESVKLLRCSTIAKNNKSYKI